jgi:hypothetical protein
MMPKPDRQDAHEGRSATDRCEHRTAARAAASGERRLNRRPVRMPQMRGADDRSAGALRRPSLGGGGMSGLTPAPTKGSMIRPASPATASRCGRLAIAHSGLRESSWLCLYQYAERTRLLRHRTGKRLATRALPPPPSPSGRPCNRRLTASGVGEWRPIQVRRRPSPRRAATCW